MAIFETIIFDFFIIFILSKQHYMAGGLGTVASLFLPALTMGAINMPYLSEFSLIEN